LKALVEAGASLQLTDRHGKTPLELARSYGYADMASLLENR
jgi:ankyrin repeat protein